MRKFSGIDLHSNNSVIVVSDEEDRIVYQRRLANDLAGIVQALEPHREELIGVVVEATYNWYWLVDGLMEAGYRVHLANTAAIKKYEGLKYSGDAADAAYLAQLLRLGLLPEGYIYPREARAGRDLARKRMQLVQYRTAQILAIENILARQTGGRLRSNEIKRLTAEGGPGSGLLGRCEPRAASQCGRDAHAAEPDQDARGAAAGAGALTRGLCALEERAGNRADAGDDDHARDRQHRAVRQGGQFQFLLSVR